MSERMSQMEVVATFNDAEKADRVKNRLEQGGYHAAAFNEGKLQRFWFMSRPLAQHRVCVKPEEAKSGRQFLKAADPQEHLLDGEICCPACGSPRVQYPQFTRKFITTTLVELGCLVGVPHKNFYCKDCQNTWRPVAPLRKETDPLNWPKPERDHPHLVKKED